MGRAPCCDKANVKKGPWSPEEDAKLKEYIEKHGTGGNWIALPQKAGLKRCGKSCRLRWLNYLRPNIKHGEFSDDEDRIICSLYANIGSRWSIIAAQLPGRTDNDIKNYWNTKLKKKLIGMINNPPPIINSQRKPQAATTHFSLPSSPSTTLSSSSSSYTCSNNNKTTTYNYSTTPLVRSTFTEPIIPFSSSPLLTNHILLQSPQDRNFVGPMQHYHHHQVKDSLIMFGGGGGDQAASCSSSDGSCGANNNSTEQLGLQSYLYNGVEEDQKLQLVSNGFSWGDNNPVLDYGLEEIKQLISCSTSCCNNNSFLFDENKTDQERVMYYY